MVFAYRRNGLQRYFGRFGRLFCDVLYIPACGCDYRINKIQEQLNFDVNKINEQVSFNKLKMMFIIDVLNDKIDLKKMTKKDLIEYFKTVYNETNLENISKIISIPVHSLTADAVKELECKPETKRANIPNEY